MEHRKLERISIQHGNLSHSVSYVLDEVRAIERTSFLGFGSFFLATFDYFPCPKLLDPTPIQFIPTRLVPCHTDLYCFLYYKLYRFFTVF